MGSADNPVLLDRASVAEARVVIGANDGAIPDPVSARPLPTRQIVEYAKHLDPRLDIVVRTHRLTELRFLQDHGVGAGAMSARGPWANSS